MHSVHGNVNLAIPNPFNKRQQLIPQDVSTTDADNLAMKMLSPTTSPSYVHSNVTLTSKLLQPPIFFNIYSEAYVLTSPPTFKFLISCTAADTNHYKLCLDDNNEQVDEIEDYLNCRHLSTGEAAWRTMGFHITKIRPAVTAVPVHLAELWPLPPSRRNASPPRSPLQHYFDRPHGFFTHQSLRKSFDDIHYLTYFRLFRLEKYNPENDGKSNYFLESCSDSPMHVILRDSGRIHFA